MKDQRPNRRSFLAGAVGFTAARRVLGANDRVNVAFAGLGGRGSWLLKLVLERAAQQGDVQVVGLCDVYRRRLNKAAESVPGAKTYLHHQEMLDGGGIDAVFIATPDHWHAPIAISAMEKGKDVYCEKPMAHTPEDAIAMAHKARDLKRVLQVGVQSTSWSKWHKAHEAIASGTLGQVISCHGTYSRNDPSGDWNWPIDPDAGPAATGDGFIDWQQWLGPAPRRPFDADRFFRFRKYWDYSGGIATDLNYHTVAPFHLAVRNEYPLRVTGMGGLWVYNDGREVPDTFLDAADYPSKFQILVQSSQNNAHGPATMIRGQRATMLMGEDWEGREMNTLRIVPEKPFSAEFKARHGTDEIVVEGAGNEGDRKHVDNFFECVRSRREPNCGPELGAKVMVHIGLAVRSYRQGRMFYFDAERERVLDRAPA